ncbi:chemotaxis protein CheW [Desulfococcaceae bacterium HSG9]|nr:chemotaxis protein CheW [Desulfococcaceae bacterium HSG9]
MPLTLAIIPALIASSEGDRYAIPQANVLELVQLQGEQIKDIEIIHSVPVFRLRGELLPLVSLGKMLKISIMDYNQMNFIGIVVLKAGGHQFGLIVDEIIDSQEIVIKPLGKQLQELKVYSGATILGDGTIALILDVMGIIEHANLKTMLDEQQKEEKIRRFKGDGDDIKQKKEGGNFRRFCSLKTLRADGWPCPSQRPPALKSCL